MLNFSRNKYKSDSLLTNKICKDVSLLTNSQTVNEQINHLQETTETIDNNKSHLQTKSIGLVFGFSIKSPKIPKHFHPSFQKAVKVTKEKKYQEAVEYWSELLKKYPESYSIRCERGSANFNKSEYGKALQDLNMAIKQKPMKTKGYFIRLKVYKAMKRFDDALSDIDFILYINPKDKDAEYTRIQILIHLKRQASYEDALKSLMSELQSNPNDIKLLSVRGNVYRLLHQYNNALADFNHVLKLCPKYVFALLSRSKVYRVQELLFNARYDIDEALQLDPQNPKLLRNRGKINFLSKFHLNACEDLDESLKIEEHPSGYRYRGKALLVMKKYSEAIADFNKALEMKPQNEKYICFDRGETLFKLGEFKKALSDLDKALEFTQDLAIISQIHQLRVSAYEELGHKQEARLALENIIKLQPTNLKVIHQHADLCESLSLYIDSLSNWNRLYKLLDPKSNLEYDKKAIKAVLLNRGRILTKLCRYEEALSDFNQGLKLFPQNVSLLCYRAEIYQQLGRHEEALNDLNNNIDQPKNACQFYVTRAGIYISLGKYPEAYQDLKICLEPKFDITSEVSYNSYTLGLCYRGSIYRIYKKYDKALIDLNRVIQRDPNNVLALCERSAIYREQGQFDDAWNDIEKMLLLDCLEIEQ
ncbi:70_t:CDS:2 [Cetraspora pellucida]|uniref:70_t:CDS:1 n=1 Tax=Cetraspora pellucida TaxID=1433469 RepID=A0A9N8VP82_9GLOM|nr:70_t:CDS:2 [Cetraspora pellucida]